MKTILDEGNLCTNDIRAAESGGEQVSSKLKRKVLDVLRERDLLPRVAQVGANGQEAKRRDELTRRASVGMEAKRVGGGLRASNQRERQRNNANNQATQMDRPRSVNGACVGQYQANPVPRTAIFESGRPVQAKVLPNNTLVEELSKRHTNLLPKVTRVSAKMVELFKWCKPRVGSCDTAAARTKRRANQIGAGYVNTNIVLSDDEDEENEEGKEEENNETRREGERNIDENCDRKQANLANKQTSVTSIRRPNRTRRRALKFRVPETISRLNTSLTPDNYNRALCILTNDVRYQLHLLLYRRLQTIWTLFSTILCILLPILCFATLESLVIVGSCSLWLLFQLTGALVTRQLCKKLDQMLEKAVAQVNGYFMDHNLMLGVINVGGLLVRARLLIPLLYFDTTQCREQIESILNADLRKQSDDADDGRDKPIKLAPGEQKWRNIKQEHKFALNYSKIGLHKIGPENRISFAQSQLAKKIVLRYSQRWISFYDKQKLMFADDKIKPRHLSTGKCLCQFIEEHFKYDDFDHKYEHESDQGSEHFEQQLECRQQQTTVIEGANGVQPKSMIESLSEEFDGESNSLASRKISPLYSLYNNANNTYISPDLSLQQQLDLLVPSLSHLVSMKERPDQFSIQMESTIRSSEFDSLTSSKMLQNFASYLQQERLESNSSPTTERSLDLTEASDSMLSGRTDELFRRLKLLLDSRKDEFSRGLNGSQATSTQPSPNNRPPTIISDKCLSEQMRHNFHSESTQTINQAKTTSNSASPISQLGKRFFGQTDGIFFLGSKKNHQGVYGKQSQQQVLQIC